MSSKQTVFSGDSFQLGYRFQSYWDFHMATAFFFGELGAGLFLVSMYFGFVPGMVLGLICTGVGKPYYHMSHMGVPMKSWRAILRPDRSWISRGLIGIVVFVPCGALVVLDSLFGWSGGGMLGKLVQILTVVSSLLVMTYQGFAMSHSSAIALWSSGLMPVASLVYALTSGAAVTLALSLMFGGIDPLALSNIVIVLVVVTLVVLLGLLHASYHGTAGARQSLELLIRGRFARQFLLLVFGAGVVLPLLALWLGGTSILGGLIAAVGVVAGFYYFRLLIFRAGVFEPQISFAARFGLS
jgi:formate-dependent nitrite reductase membrane component NrfD